MIEKRMKKEKWNFVFLLFIVILLSTTFSTASATTATAETCTVGPAQQLLASDAALSDNFGVSVAISGDVAIVGAHLHDALGTNSGTAYIFHWDGSSWVQQQKLQALDQAAYDLFGMSVAIDNDTAVVVSPGKYTDTVQTGATYIFRYNGSSWVQQQKLPVGVSGDMDTISATATVAANVIVIGNSLDRTRGLLAGAADVFYWNGSTWVQMPKLFAADAAAVDFFGFSVAAFDEWIVIGAYGDDDRGQMSGSAYVFTRNDNGTPLNANDDFWEQQQKLVPADGVAYNYVGKSVAIDGGTIVVGASGDSSSGFNFGSAYVYRLSGSTWVYEAELFGSDSKTDGSFGGSVGVSGNIVIVGAYKEKPFWTNGGSAYVYRKNASTWSQEARLADPDAYGENYFGYSVGASEDRTLVGAYNALRIGTANAFDLTCTAPTYHPADSDNGFRINISEATKYGSYWKNGQTWPTPPNPIPIDYATSAGYIWKNGETYHYDSGFTCPQCWVVGP